VKTEERAHEPLMFDTENEPITGLKRCKHCGLSETHWWRWPVCESRSMAKRIEIQAAPGASQ